MAVVVLLLLAVVGVLVVAVPPAVQVVVEEVLPLVAGPAALAIRHSLSVRLPVPPPWQPSAAL